ncbi:hypothetical protein [uncultured Desulfovibrio sp.]|uniref:hypothetical protein n=1 Tax=uncultured Desulfovibrio sp. TaxID=167968 RepID=UPI002671CAC3|nr:hypothetical protein [uncultured Desulfovibrio sp.]
MGFDLTPLFALNFGKRIVLIVLGMGLYVLPEILKATMNVQLTSTKIAIISIFGLALAGLGAWSILFRYGVRED